MPGTVLITGISRGLGKEIAKKFSQNGWRIVSGFDVTDRKAVHEAIKVIDKLDVVVNNAGINKDQLLARTLPEDWNRIIDVNLTGVFNVCREAIKLMRREGGHIVNISSMAGLTGRAGQCHYSASKAGIVGFSKSLAKEVSRWNIKVNVILPGYMKTDMFTPLETSSLKGQAVIERARRENILGRINEPSDIAKFIYHLVQLDFISGQVFNLDSRII